MSLKIFLFTELVITTTLVLLNRTIIHIISLQELIISCGSDDDANFI